MNWWKKLRLFRQKRAQVPVWDSLDRDTLKVWIRDPENLRRLKEQRVRQMGWARNQPQRLEPEPILEDMSHELWKC